MKKNNGYCPRGLYQMMITGTEWHQCVKTVGIKTQYPYDTWWKDLE